MPPSDNDGGMTDSEWDVVVIGVNRSLARWDVKAGRGMDYFVANNPYAECMSCLPAGHTHFPPCVASVRTNPDFLTRYRGPKFRYHPTCEDGFVHPGSPAGTLDDYRNPVCAAIAVAHRMRATRLLLVCCDESFADERPAIAQRRPRSSPNCSNR